MTGNAGTVIVGGGLAAVRTAEQLRRHNYPTGVYSSARVPQQVRWARSKIAEALQRA